MACLSPSDPHQLLLCGICAEPYDDNTHQAKFLTCFHTFCFDCLTKLLNRGLYNTSIIHCPNCRSITRLPQNGVNGLQTNFYIASFQEISRNIEPARNVANIKGCHGHKMQPLSYFCLTCGVSACSKCTAEEHTADNGHSVISVSQSETSYLQELNVSQKSLNQNKRKLKLIESEIALLTAAKKSALEEMDTFIKHAHEQLEQRRNVLKGQILDQFNAQQNALTDKKNQIKEAITLINKTSAQAKNITKTGEINKLKPFCECLKEVNEKTLKFSNLDLGENYFSFDATRGLDKFNECLCTLGQIYCKGSLPTRMRFKGPDSIAGQKSVLTVEVFNHSGNIQPISSDSFSVQITDSMATVVHNVFSTTEPDCTVTFTPQTGGLHEISGTFLGQKLICEPTHISVYSDNPVMKLGKEGSGSGNFKFPWSIAIDNNDFLYVADRSNRLIQKFSANGDFLSQFSVNGHDKDCTTLDLALDQNNGSIYCTDVVLKDDKYYPGNKLLVFDLEGQLQDVSPFNDMTNPLFIVTNSCGDMIISDIGKHCLFKVNKERDILCRMGDFKYPCFIAITDDDTIIASDKMSDCIFLFNPDGTFKHKFGSSGNGEGQLKEPWGVATDGENILVADGTNNRIQVFKLDGTFVSMIESKDDPLNDPRGLAVTKDGYVNVADCSNHCIKKYKYRNVAQWQEQSSWIDLEEATKTNGNSVLLLFFYVKRQIYFSMFKSTLIHIDKHE